MRYFNTVFVVFLLLLTSGCVSRIADKESDKTAPQKFTAKDVQAGKVLAEKYMNALVEAVKTKDFNKISPYLQVDMLSVRQKKTVFNEMCKRFELNGKIVSHTLVGVFDQTLCKDYVWQIDFEKQTTSEKLPVLKTTMLYTIRVVVSDGKPEIVRARLIQL